MDDEPTATAKRGDLVWVHRRLDSIAQYWEPGKVTSITRDGRVKVYESVPSWAPAIRLPERMDLVLRVSGSPLFVVSQTQVNVDRVLEAWGAIAFTDLQTIEQVREFTKPFRITAGIERT